MKIIDLEAHFYTRSYVEYLRKRKSVPREDHAGDVNRLWYTDKLWSPRNLKMEAKLLDLDEGRLQAMDEAGITSQVIMLSAPHIQQFSPAEGAKWARQVNNEVAEVLKKYPDRFIGLASIAPQSPLDAADEIERAVTELGFKGVGIQSHARNEYLDAKKYWPVFERAEKLDVPIYLHPSVPAKSILKGFDDYGWDFASAPFGYQVDASLHAIRLMHSGLFDRYPGLKFILGHMGEGLPYWLWRIDFRWLKSATGRQPRLGKRPSEYFKENFWISTSGMFYNPALLCAQMGVGSDRILFAVDYPYEANKEAVDFINSAPVSAEDKEKIFHLNAEKLFKL
jgi:2,3-dihydroxybenzoate decarboxylase